MGYAKAKIMILLCFSTTALFCQIEMIPNWIKIDSSTNKTSEAWGIDVDENNNVYWVISNDNLSQGLDVYCYKYQSSGNPVWSNPFIYGGSGTQHAYVCNVEESGLYIGGRECPGLVTSCDMMLLRVDKNSGELIWSETKNFAADGYDEIDGLEITTEGIFCGGWCQELDPSIYRSDIGLWKLDLDGNTEWSNTLGSELTAEHQDGHFVVDDNYIYAAGLWGGKGIANLHNGHSFLGKFDKTNGNLIDSTLFGYQSNSFNDIENALGMTSDGTNLYITGYTTPYAENDWQIFVAKYDKNLNQSWFIDWGGSGSESARSIRVLGDKIFIGGLTESESILTGGGKRDALLLTLDTSGTVLSYSTFGIGDNNESFQDLVVQNGKIYLSGTMENDQLHKKAILVSVDDPFSNSKNEINSSLLYDFQINPNPSNGKVSIVFSNEHHGANQFNLYNLSGKLLQSRTLREKSKEYQWNIDHTGQLLFEVQFENYRISKKLINY